MLHRPSGGGEGEQPLSSQNEVLDGATSRGRCRGPLFWGISGRTTAAYLWVIPGCGYMEVEGRVVFLDGIPPVGVVSPSLPGRVRVNALSPIKKKKKRVSCEEGAVE